MDLEQFLQENGYEKSRFSNEELDEIEKGLAAGLTFEQVKLYADSKFSSKQMKNIRTGMEQAISIKENEQRKKDSEEFVRSLPKVFSDDQMAILNSGIYNGLSPYQIAVYANPNYTAEKMACIHNGFKYELTMEQTDAYKNFDVQEMYAIQNGFYCGMTLEQVEYMKSHARTADEMAQIVLCYKTNLSENQIDYVLSHAKDANEMYEIRQGFAEHLSMDQIKIYAENHLSSEKMSIIRYGLRNNLSKEQIQFVLDTDFSADKMAQLIHGFTNGLTMEQVEMYSKPEYNINQMYEIRTGIKNGLSEENIMSYAAPENDWGMMACIRENLEGNLPKEDLDHFLHGGFSKSQIREIAFGLSGELGLENIKLYADPKISSEKMEDLREKIEDIRNRYHSEYSNEKIENYAYAYKNGLSINQSEYLIESCKLEKDEISIIIKGMKLQNHPQNKSVNEKLAGIESKHGSTEKGNMRENR